MCKSNADKYKIILIQCGQWTKCTKNFKSAFKYIYFNLYNIKCNKIKMISSDVKSIFAVEKSINSFNF